VTADPMPLQGGPRQSSDGSGMPGPAGLTRLTPAKQADENAVAAFAYWIILNMNRLRGNRRMKSLLVREHPGAFRY
jgi:hypothetical protein